MMSNQTDRLWTPDDLATFLGYTRSTITTLCSRAPDKLPPRVSKLHAPRWSPDVCKAWVLKHTSGEGKRKGGRPRG